MNFVAHTTDATLERYSMRTIPATESDRLEEHLLMCQPCRDRLKATDEYLAAMRSAAAKIRESGKDE